MKSWKRKRQRQHKNQYFIHQNTDHSETKVHYSRWGKRRAKKDPKNWTGLYYSFVQPWGLKYYRQKEDLKQKADDKAMKQALSLFKEYPYMESCNGHPCKVTDITQRDGFGLDYEGVSLLNGVSDGCSYFNCAITHLTEQEAFERRDFILKYGYLAYQINYNSDHSWFTDKESTTGFIRSNMSYLNNQTDDKDNHKGYESYFTSEGKEWVKEKFDIDIDSLTPMTEEEMDEYFQNI
jgi:hypothetical protein